MPSTNLGLFRAAAPLASPATALHVHKAAVAIAMIFALSRVGPSAGPRVEALLACLKFDGDVARHLLTRFSDGATHSSGSKSSDDGDE